MAEVELAGRWLLVVLGLGWLAMPILRWLTPGLADGGLSLARPLALLLVGYLAWLPAALKLVPFATASWLLGLPVLIGLSLAAVIARRRATAPRSLPLGHLLAHEAVFILVFIGFAWLRGYTPDITATEKPMELMFLNSTLRATTMPPPDGWLAGYGINYYYLGYVIAATLGHLTSTPLGYLFNLMLTTIVALAASTVYGLAANLWAGRAPQPRLTAAGGGVGLLAAYLLVASGNLVAGWRWLSEPTRTVAQSWWEGIGWNSSRVLVDQLPGGPWPNITEFPWFSFILGDLHPHVLALPFGLLAIGLAADWWHHSPVLGLVKRQPLAAVRLLVGALAVGALYAINSWDFPIYLGLLGLALSRPAWDGPIGYRLAWRPVTLALGALIGLSVALLGPFYLSFVSFAGNAGVQLPGGLERWPLLGGLVRTVGLVTWGRTDLGEFLQIYGLFAGAGLAWAALIARRGLRLAPNLLGLALIGIALLGTLFGSAPLALAGAVALLALLVWRLGPASDGEGLLAILLALGLALPIGAEFIFLQDVFANRMNTIFKTYYQSWTLLSPVAAVGVGALLATAAEIVRQPRGQRGMLPILGGSLVLVLLVGLTAAYPLIATRQRAEGFQQRAGLDGLAYLANHPDEQAALTWLREQVPPGTVVAEDPGRSYGDYRGVPHARAATIGGSLAPLGWPGHEQQWRGNQPMAQAEIGRRLNDIQQLYGTTDPAVAQRIIDQYNIDYVYVGPWERATDGRERVYSPAALAKFDQFMAVAFRQGAVTIYKRRS